MINSEGVAKITDFGIARAMDKSSNEKNTEAVIMGSLDGRASCRERV